MHIYNTKKLKKQTLKKKWKSERGGGGPTPDLSNWHTLYIVLSNIYI